MSTFRLPVEQVGLEQSIQRAMRKFQNNPLKINVNDKSFTQPLGRITASADEFTKSIEASNARVVAFGASVAVINSIQNAFKQMVVQTVAVEKSLAEINVVLGATSANLEKFGDNLFKISKNTAQSFDQVAAAATEFARQGLSVEKTLQRTNDALVLTRLTGMKATDAVKGLTAAVNSFADAGVNTTEVMNKLAAVDMAFAVSSEDLINGLSRAAAVAQDAGMNIDQLIGAITSAQQITARGGAVIGNSFKTIFTRIQRPETIDQLEQLGVAVRDVQGNVLPAIKILESLARTYDTLTQAQQSNTAQLVGGMFQINVLKAAMRDLGKENSITAQAIKISSQATDEASKKNEQLNKTMAALTSRTLTSLQQLAAQIGEITVGPGIEKILKAVNGLAEGITNVLDGEGIASDFANGFLKGLGNIITGPGAVLILGLVGKLFIDVGKFAKTSLGNFMGMTTEAQKQKQVQESILNILRTNSEIAGQLIGQGQTKSQQEQVMLDLIVKQTAAHREQLRVAKELSRVAVAAGANAELVIPRRRRASGHIPNFAKKERQGAIEGGYAPGAIKSMNMPGEGMIIYNSAEKIKKIKGFQQPFINPPASSRAGKEHRQRSMDIYGVDPYASKGYVPNFVGAGAFMKRKGATLKDLEKGVAGGEISGAGAQNLSPEIYAAVKRGLNAKKAAVAKTKAQKEAELNASKIKINAGSSDFGGPFAALIPQRNANFDNAFKVIDSTFKKGKNTYPFVMTNLAVRGPTIPVPEGQVTEPDESKIEKNISKSIFDNSAKYANTILPAGKGDVTSDEVKAKLLSAGGGKGAVAAAVGAGFEAAVATAYGIDSSLRTEGGDFDIKDNLQSGSLKKVNQLFGLKNYSIMDFKASASADNLKSMAKKIFNQNPSRFLDQVKKNKKKLKTASGGFIPNFAQSPLTDAIKREREAGIPVSAIRINQSDKLISSSNPTGLAVTNTIDEPRGLKDVPNFARPDSDFVSGKGLGKGGANPENWAKASRFVSEDMRKFVQRYQSFAKRSTGLTKEKFKNELATNKLTQNANKYETREALKQLGFSRQETKEALKQISAARTAAGNAMMGPGNVATAGMDSFRRRAEAPGARGFAGGVGRAGNFMGGMGFMMGAPMLGAAIDGVFKSDKSRVNMTSGERFSQNVGSNVLTGAATGAMMGGMIGSVVPVIGNAVGAAVGGTIGAIGGLAKSISEMEVSTAELAEATSEAAAAHQANTASFNAIITGTKSGKSDQETMGLISREAAKVDGIRVRGKTFTEALAESDGSDFAMDQILAEFTNQSKKGVDKAALVEGVSTFRDRIDNAFFGTGANLGVVGYGDNTQEALRMVRQDKEDTDYTQGDLDTMSKNLGQNVDLSARKQLLAKINSGDYDDFKGLELWNENLNIGKDMASIMGLQMGSVENENMAQALEDMLDEGGMSEFAEAIQKSIDAVEEERKNIKAAIEVRKNFAAKQADATKLMEKRLAQKNLDFMEVKNARAANLQAREFISRYKKLNKTIDERVEIEKDIAKNEILISAQTEKETRLQELREKLLREGITKMKKAGVTGEIKLADGTVIDKIDHARNKIANATEEELMEMLKSGETLKKITKTNTEVFRKGGELSNFLDSLSLEYDKQDGIAKQKTILDLKNVDLQSRINSLQQKEVKAREDFALDLQKRSQELGISQREIDTKLKQQLGKIDRDYNLAFGGGQKLGTNDPVALRRLQQDKEVARADAELAAAQRKIALDIEKSFTDAFSNAKNISALDSNTAAIERLTAEFMKDNQETAAKPLIEGLGRLAKSTGVKASFEGETIAQQISRKRAEKQAEHDAALNENVDSQAFQSALQGYAELASQGLKEQITVVKRGDEGWDLIKGSGESIMSPDGKRTATSEEQLQKIINSTILTMNQKDLSSKNFQGIQMPNGQFNKLWLGTQSFTGGATLRDRLPAELTSKFNDYERLQNAKTQKVSGLSRELGSLETAEAQALSHMGQLEALGVDSTGKYQAKLPKTKGGADPESSLFKFPNTKKLLSTVALSKDRDIIEKKLREGKGILSDGFLNEGGQETANTLAVIKEYKQSLESAGLTAKQRKDLEVQLNGQILNSIQSSKEAVVQYNETVKNAKHTTKLTEEENDIRNKLNNEMRDALEEAKDLNARGFSGRAQQRVFEARVAQSRGNPLIAAPSERDSFMAGFQNSLDDIPTQSEFFNQLGNTLPRTFADNMASALTEGLAGIKSWDEALQDVALGFLQTLQQALNQRLADQMLGFMGQGMNSLFGGFSRGGIVRRSSGGLVEGGSGTKDDVPAMLNSGEYVIRKAAVNKYGTEFLSSLNQGTTGRRNLGGAIEEGMGPATQEILATGPIAGPVDPAVYPSDQTGEGGYLIPSSGQAGTFAAGQIVGKENLLAFARQSHTDGRRDIIDTSGPIDRYGQTMYQGDSMNMQLEDESMRLSGLGLRQGPVADEVLQAKSQALQAVDAYDRNVAAQEKYKRDRKKAIKNAIKGVLFSAALSFGMSQLQGAMQTSAMSKSANTMNVSDHMAANNITDPSAGISSFNTANNTALTSSDVYMKGGSMNLTKATGKLNSWGVPVGQERSWVAGTQSGIGTANYATSRGSTSTFSNFFSRGATTANAAGGALASVGMQASPSGIVSQRTSFWSGNVKSPMSFTDMRGPSNSMRGVMSNQATPWRSAAGQSWSGFQVPKGNASYDFAAGRQALGSGANIRNTSAMAALGKKAAGGRISTGRVPTLLTGGEYVINKDAVRKHGLSFMNSLNSQNLNKGGKVKGASAPLSPLEDQSTILQQILDTLLEQGEQEQARAEQIQNLTEKSESTVNNTTTQEIKTKGEEQNQILSSILEAIKEQNTELPAQITNSLQNSNVVNNSTINSSSNQSSNNANSITNNTSNSSTSNSFVDNTTIQNNLLGEILETLKFPTTPAAPTPSAGGGSMGGNNVSVTVNVDGKGKSMGGEGDITNSSSTGVNSVTKDEATNMANEIKAAVLQIISEQQRLGGVLRER